MLGYGRNNFTWDGTLKEVGSRYPAVCTGRHMLCVSHILLCVFTYSTERVRAA